MREILIKLFCGISFLLSIAIINAQPNYPPPTGVWCSCPPTNGIGNGSVIPDVANKSYVIGILVRVVWKDIEPIDNIYNWSLIDDQIKAAESYGKKISLAIGSGPNTPQWLYELGASSISYSLPFSGTIPIPWDVIFLDKWTEFISELGKRYQNDTTIQLVYITNSSQNGFEMQLPHNPTPTYSSIGYSEQLVINSWTQIMDEFNEAFPNHYLTNDFHPVNNSDLVGDSIYNYAIANIGYRYGANAWWWTQKNTSVYPSQYSILQSSANSNAFSGIQMAASGIANPSSFGTGGMPEALNLAISNKVCYWEVWNNDITDGSFDSLLSNATCSVLKINENTKIENNLTVYPNQSNGSFLITLNHNNIKEIEVINQLGQIIFSKDNLKTNYYELLLDNFSDGVYFLKVIDDEKIISLRTIVMKNNE